MSVNNHIKRHHHLTLSVGNAQEDYDFHTKVLGLKSVKKTALYDGEEPILHLYYGNDTGDVSRLITCFPMKHSGRKARKGTGQICTVALSIPEGSAKFWQDHLQSRGFTVRLQERFGERLVAFQHPCGIEYELIEAKHDARKPYSNGAVPQEHGLRGTYGIVVSVRDAENSEEFMQGGWNGRRLGTDGQHLRYEVGNGGSGAIVEFRVEPNVAAGSWTYGEGVPHHVAFEVADHEAQSKVKFHLEGLGFTDVSEMKDRGYFDSVYVRTPGGALFEATVSKPMQIPPFFANRREELLEKIEPLRY
jgi:glyoxalase family protein